MRLRVASQQAHNDELDREIEKLSRERILQESLLREAVSERDQSRKTVAELQTQAQEYLSQLNEYKQIIKRMSAMHSRASSRNHSDGNKFADGSSADGEHKRPPIDRRPPARSPPPEMYANQGEEFSTEVILIQENERLRKKLTALKRAVLSDKSHKLMKQEALEVLSLLTSMEDFLNNQRGIIREEDFS